MKKGSPTEIAETILQRSTCAVQVGACIIDTWGRVLSWGWNHSGQDGLGEHAEMHALGRANKVRLYGAVRIYVAAQRRRNGKPVLALPCSECQMLISKYRMGVTYRDGRGVWRVV